VSFAPEEREQQWPNNTGNPFYWHGQVRVANWPWKTGADRTVYPQDRHHPIGRTAALIPT
jgi:hypothetical protein